MLALLVPAALSAQSLQKQPRDPAERGQNVGFDVKRYFADVDEFNGTRVLPTGRLTIGYAF